MSQSSAIGRAAALVKANEISSAAAELVVSDFNGSFLLAWRIVIPTDGPTWQVFIDARSGKVLSQPRDLNRYVNGTGQVFMVNAIVATQDNSLRDNLDAASAVPLNAYTTVTLQGLLGNGFLDGDFASSS